MNESLYPFVNQTSYDTRALSALNLMAEATVRKEKSQKTRMLCLILGALGIANMWAAIISDVGVMILAVLNAIRALSVRNL